MEKDDQTEENLLKGKILGRVVIEILGNPKEYVKKTTEEYIKKLKDDPDLEFIKEYVAEPEEKEKGFVLFAEFEIWFNGMEKMFAFCLDAMPSSVEILEPSDFMIKAPEFSNMLNDLQSKLHELDLLVKQIRVQNKTLDSNGKTILANLILLSVKENNKSLDQISGEAGIKPEAIKPFLDDLINKGQIELVDDRWYKLKDGKKRG